MSDPRRVLLTGVTGLVGGQIMQLGVGRHDLRIVGLSRREVPLPQGARMEMLVADPALWSESIAAIAPDAAICALGTTWRKASKDEARFREVDQELVLSVARAARAAGASNFVLVSSVGADRGSRAFYLRVKGEVEAALRTLGFHRLDILRPGLLRELRGADRRTGERLAILASPVTDMFLHGSRRRYRSIDARFVARAALQCALEKARGVFVHDNDAIMRAARRLGGAT